MTKEQTPKKVWLVRGGSQGEDEVTALEKGLAIIGYREVGDLSRFGAPEDLAQEILRKIAAPQRSAENKARQLWTFREHIEAGDIVAMPLKTRRGQIAVGQVSGPYRYVEIDGTKRHTRAVKWTHPDLPRSALRQDLLHSLGAFLTVCRITRNGAEERIAAVLSGKPDPGPLEKDEKENPSREEAPQDTGERIDLEQAARDEVAAFIRERFQAHDMARLVEAVLKAEGFTTQRSEPGPDGGADILAGRGPLGLDAPFLCVQVKATAEPADVRILRELGGTMESFKATQGLLVCWGGFKQSVVREARQQAFKIRLWDQSGLVEAIYRNYDRLSPEIQAELPLKRAWLLVHEDEESNG